jgi:PKD repeat protein
VNEAGSKQRTPDLRALIQAIVSRSGWVSGNDITILITGTGHRTAWAWDGSASKAPVLHVEWGGCGGGTTNQPPNGTIDTPREDVTITAGQSVSFTGTGLDPDGNTPLGFLWNFGGGASNRSVEDPGSVSFTTAGTYTVTFTVRDSLGLADPTPATRVVRVNPTGGGTTRLDRAVGASSDDAEENASGSMSLSSSDLELTQDSSTQKIGIRFANITVPRGATIRAAWIQFTSKETQSMSTALTIKAQAIDNAPTFATSSGNISSRTAASAAVAWTPAAWTATNEAAAVERTPDLTAVIQQVVGRSGWSSGNALAILITGTGHRTAYSFDGSATKGAVLHIEY